MYLREEKICLITGANSGIGKASAEALANLGTVVILVSRNHTRGERTLAELSEITGNKNLHLFISDLSSQAAILKLVNEIKTKFDSLDILINNAGAFFCKRHITVDGIEAAFAINYLSRFLLTNLLLDLILKSKQGRIINVSCNFALRKGISFEELPFLKKYSPIKSAALARTADILFINELSRRLKNTKITANSLHPGYVATNIIANDPDSSVVKRIIYKGIRPFLKTPEKGAETVIYLASSPEVSNVSGKYFIDKKYIKPHPEIYNEELSKRLWKLSESIIKVNIPPDTFSEKKFFSELKIE